MQNSDHSSDISLSCINKLKLDSFSLTFPGNLYQIVMES